ncbi:MAG: hypothetical protein OXU23_06700 [Candidatus Poribacteria bacterium]|nr:hypothetical protein [Candidatus Poribacteria bacterium]
MKNDDVELIQQVLAGDENAFAELVKKYRIIYYNKNLLVNPFQKADFIDFY